MIFHIAVEVAMTRPAGNVRTVWVNVDQPETGDDWRDEVLAHVLAAHIAGTNGFAQILTARTLSVDI